MNLKKIYLSVFLVCLLISTGATAQVTGKPKELLRKSEPIEIVADKMEAFQEKRMIVFSGNAVATQGDIKLQTDRLSIYYKRALDRKEKIGKQDVETAGDLEKIELTGHVVITQKEISATSDEAVYDQAKAVFIMTGNPVLQQGKTTIKGCRVIIYIDENRGKVEQCEGEKQGRVTAVIHPNQKK